MVSSKLVMVVGDTCSAGVLCNIQGDDMVNYEHKVRYGSDNHMVELTDIIATFFRLLLLLLLPLLLLILLPLLLQ